jgi:tRNA-2-methylthio-N6-dimethylallyladenosine synthase
MPGQVPKEVVQARYDRLVAVQEDISWALNREQVGHQVEVLLAEGEGRKDERTRRRSGRARDNRLVHLSGADAARPGDCVTVLVESAAPHHLTGTAVAVRPTRAGDAWAAGQGGCGTEAAAAPAAGGVALGMPTMPVRA